MMPTVSDLSLPRILVGGNTFKEAVKTPPMGMFLLNTDHDWLEQWVVDHWEVVGKYASGTADDPLANYQLAAARGAGLGTAGGGGVSPAPGGNVGTPAAPFPSACTAVSQSGDPGAIGAGRFWLAPGPLLYVRDATDTNWLQVCLV